MNSSLDLRLYFAQKAIINAALWTKQNTDRALYRSIFLPSLKTIKLVDSVATWLMAGCGATAALLVSNWGSLSDRLSPEAVKTTIALLLGSFLFGCAEKTGAIYVQIMCDTDEAVTSLMGQVLEKHNQEEEKLQAAAQKVEFDFGSIELDFGQPIYDLVMTTPFFIRWRVKQVTQKTLEDWRYPYKSAMRAYHGATSAFVLQALSFVLALAYAAMAIQLR